MTTVETPSVRLKTLLACDLVRSTALTERVGDERAAKLLWQHDQLARSLLAECGGTEIDKADGFLLLFERPVEALNFSISYHDALASLSRDTDLEIESRVAIHVGEVYLRRNAPDDVARGAKPLEVEGLAKPALARLLGLCSARQTLLSRAAFDLARRGSSGIADPERLRWLSHGAYQFAGILEPIEVFEVGVAGRAPLTAPRDTQKAHRVGRSGASLLVLPFQNLSGEREYDFISDGLTEEVIISLSSLRSLKVISRTSAMQLVGTKKDIQQIARDVDVRYVLEGAVRKSGDDLRTTAKLMDAETNETLWAERFDGRVNDLFQTQEAIAVAVLDAFKLRVDQPQSRRLPRRPIPDVRAYEYYLRARQEASLFTPEAVERAFGYLERGIEVVGEDNVQLQAAIGYLHWQSFNIGLNTDPASLEKARRCAEHIARIDPESPDAHRLFGLVAVHTGAGPTQVIRHLRRCQDANPYDADTLLWLSMMYAFNGQPQSGHDLARSLVEIDPLTPLYQVMPGFLVLCEGDFVRAEPMLRAADDANERSNPVVAVVYAQALAFVGRRDEAQARLLAVEESAGDSFFGWLARFLRLALSGDSEAARQSVTQGLIEVARPDMQWSWTMAEAYAQAGVPGEALDWLSNAANRGFINYPFLFEQDPLLASLHGQLGFAGLATRVRDQWNQEAEALRLSGSTKG